MSPLSVKLRECMQRSSRLWNVFSCGLHHGSSSSCLWKRNFAAVHCKTSQLLVSQPTIVANHSASFHQSSTHCQDQTERLWSVYNETKRQTGGKNTTTHSFINRQHCRHLRCCWCSSTQLWTSNSHSRKFHKNVFSIKKWSVTSV